MPPKGSFSPPSTLGSVEDRNGSYRMQLPQMRDLRVKRPTHGPHRTTRAQAKKDLTAAQQCASRKDMLQFVLALGGETAEKAAAEKAAAPQASNPVGSQEPGEIGRAHV